MARMPDMDGQTDTNIFDEKEFVLIVTYGASSALTFQGKDASIAKTTTTTFTVTLPKPYREITGLIQGWKKATGADPLQYQITTDSVASDGTLILTTVSTNSAGTATAPADGDKVYLRIRVSDSWLNAKFTGSSS